MSLFNKYSYFLVDRLSSFDSSCVEGLTEISVKFAFVKGKGSKFIKEYPGLANWFIVDLWLYKPLWAGNIFTKRQWIE